MRKEIEDRNQEEKEIENFLSRFDDSDSNNSSKDSITTDPGSGSPGDRDFIVSEDGVDLTSVTNKDHKARRKVALFDKASRRYEKEKKNSNSMNGTHSKKKKSFLSGDTMKEKLTLLFKKENPNYRPGAGSTVNVNGKEVKNSLYLFSPLRTLRTLIVLFAIMVVIFFIYCFIVISMAPKIDPSKLYDNIAESSTVYNDEGKAIDNVYYTEDRKFISYDDLPANAVNAFVALEDKTFWKHHGFNWTRMMGAVVQSVTGSGAISGTLPPPTNTKYHYPTLH